MPSEAQVLEQNNQNLKITKTKVLKEIKESISNVGGKQEINKRNKVDISVVPNIRVKVHNRWGKE